MARSFIKLCSEQDFLEFGKIYARAYPGSGVAAEVIAQKLHEMSGSDEASEFAGIMDHDLLVGGMRQILFRMCCFGRMILAGGVGSIAVDLLHKKRGLARDLVRHFLDYCEREGATLAFLYPFRPDFYYQMGFGYGTKMNQYSFSPSSLPLRRFDGELVYLGGEDLPLIRECYERLAAKKHGYCFKSQWEYAGLIKNFAAPGMMVGYKAGNELKGYITFGFRKDNEDNFLKHNLVIREWLWETPDALHGLCRFLHSQADQVNRIIFNTQDPDFFWLLKDVRNPSDNLIPSVYHESNTAGVGVMYRIVSVPGFIVANAERDFNGATLNLTLQVDDALRPQNQGDYHLVISDGRMTLVETAPENATTLKLDIAELSALFMGSIDLKTLFTLGKVDLAPREVEYLHRAFRVESRPECISVF